MLGDSQKALIIKERAYYEIERVFVIEWGDLGRDDRAIRGSNCGEQ